MELIQDMERVKEEFSNATYLAHLYENPFIFVVEGEVRLDGDMRIEGNTAIIEMVKSHGFRKGNGRQFVEYLKAREDIELIVGESIPAAVPFWYKMNAKFKESEFNAFLEDDCDDEMLLRFSISCN